MQYYILSEKLTVTEFWKKSEIILKPSGLSCQNSSKVPFKKSDSSIILEKCAERTPKPFGFSGQNYSKIQIRIVIEEFLVQMTLVLSRYFK